MNKRIATVAAAILTTLLLVSCSAGPAPTTAPSQAAPETSSPATAAPAASPTDAPTASPAPVPTAAPAGAEGLAVGRFAAADANAYYCVKGYQIVRLDKSTMAETTIREISDLFHIYSIFLDANGSLYYLCCENETDDCSNTLYRWINEPGEDVQDTILAENVAFVLRVTANEIYYLDDTGQLCAYDIAASQVKQTGFSGFDLASPPRVSNASPYIVVQKYEDEGGDKSFRYNCADNTLDEIKEAGDGCIATDDGRYLLFYTLNDGNIISKATLYDINAGKAIFDDFDMSGLRCDSINSALVTDGTLYLMTAAGNDDKVCRIDTTTLAAGDVLAFPNAAGNGNMRTAWYAGRYWLLYYETVTAGTADEPKEVTPKLGVLNLESDAVSYIEDFKAMDFDPAHRGGIDVFDNYLFLCEDKSIYAPNTGQYQYTGFVDLSKIQ